MTREIFNKTDLEMDDVSSLLHFSTPITASEFFMEEWNESIWAQTLSPEYQLICIEYVHVNDDGCSSDMKKVFYPMINKSINHKKLVEEFGLAVYKQLCVDYGYENIDAFHLMYVLRGVVICISYVLNCEHPAIYEQDIFNVKMNGLLITEVTEIEDTDRELLKPSLLTTFQAEREKIIGAEEELEEADSDHVEYIHLPDLIKNAENHGSFMLYNEFFLPDANIEYVPNHGFYLYEQGDDESLEHLLAKGQYDWQAAFDKIETLPKVDKLNVMNGWIMVPTGE